MPPRQPRNDAAEESATPGTALAIPQDVMADLLRAQQGQIQTTPRLPLIKVLPAAVGLFEFADTNETTREFSGVILNTHARNTLWDRPFGSAAPNPTGEKEKPACSSRDGVTGVPKVGFRHAALGGRSAVEGDRVPCGTCPYNQWESKHLIGGTGKGKAVTNQRSLYVLVPGRAMPSELILAPTSISAFDEYLLHLLNRSTPVQAVLTKFAQQRVTKGTLVWSAVTFQAERSLTMEEFQSVMAKRSTFSAAMNPSTPTVEEAETFAGATGATEGGEDTDEIPF